ncbi:MAG: hypothetical protein A2580_00425 [Hydrogenophilales bacterium RIFOXYD1_FULL_62_11]|nr:MAG: hypothetical protein A2580_00425 [Hydrogenophilales bacterium RIFOXYD1_FULL_62_11]
MRDEDTVIRAEHEFKKFIWRSTIEVGEALERSATWIIGGVAAIVAVVVSNLDSVAKISSLDGIKASVVLFTLSLLFGALSKQVGMAVVAGVNTLKETEALLNSEAGRRLMDQMTMEPRQLAQELATEAKAEYAINATAAAILLLVKEAG